ncbi:SDR family oxidoreductase [Thiohalomonas denitrificans]|uniref:Short-chain dehydrogenase n=1 Tax=Thiohalomonas denitrificans TaxID=415747 RepID=A0A1G5Q3L9_9GAMM|nr:SDR family oxidoreductase [Thiohalomonas denitrificans]SCZ56208.1 Short-chain dehydrogenase [Thiohalomonas denitrificans]
MARSDVVVVTGASAGIGRAAAIEFGRRGCRVALLARGIEGLEGARHEVVHAGGSALVIPADVSDPEQVESAAQRVEGELGQIKIWVNSAMVTVFSAIDDLTPEEIRRVTEVTYLGTVHGTLSALRRMKRHGRGTIVQVGSALSYRSIPLQSAYCGAKFAIRGFTDSLRSELIHDHSPVHITMVQLAAFNTPQFQWSRTHIDRHPQPLPPIFQPELAARGIVFAAYHQRRELWVGGPTLKTIIGSRLLSGYLDRYLADKAYSGQMTDWPLDEERPDNLFHPARGDFGRYGPFDESAKERSLQFWMVTHRSTTWTLAFVVALIVVTVLLL